LKPAFGYLGYLRFDELFVEFFGYQKLLVFLLSILHGVLEHFEISFKSFEVFDFWLLGLITILGSLVVGFTVVHLAVIQSRLKLALLLYTLG